MNCFCTSPTNTNGDCCNANDLCNFSGNLDDVSAVPIYVQSVYDAVRFHLQGMKTVQGLKFTPAIPCGCTVHRITEIRCKKFFDPCNAKDQNNLTLDMETGISGAYFVNDCKGVVETIGPDGVPSEKLLFADTSSCDESGCGTPIFGTQNVRLWGNINVYMDLVLCDSCGRESTMTVCAEVNIAKPTHPLVLTNFFELCMPSTGESAFLPRLTELANAGFTCRLATNSASRDICIGPNGEITANLIVAICVVCEKKITVPVQLCVLSSGFAEAPLQENASGIINCPGLFPERTNPASGANSCGSVPDPCAPDPCCDPCCPPSPDDCGCGCGDFPPQTCR
ncbi:MAG: hypothetical protein Q4C25_03830 [Bacillota bacterium]|nr:hypothetical protein [Bacillota bacterium]